MWKLSRRQVAVGLVAIWGLLVGVGIRSIFSYATTLGARVDTPRVWPTKEVGKGTGQGLAIARSIVVDKYHGKLSFESIVGNGTTFYVTLPIARQQQEAA